MALFKRGFGRRDLLVHRCLGMSRHQIEPDADRAERGFTAVGQGQPVFECYESGAADDLVGFDVQSEGVPQRRRTGGRSAADNRALDFGNVPGPATTPGGEACAEQPQQHCTARKRQPRGPPGLFVRSGLW